MTVLSKEQGRALLAVKPKKRKYRNEPCIIDGIKFASKAEGAYYAKLKQREKAGEVGGVEMQRRFDIRGARGEVICVYVADFCFWDHTADRFRVIDVKGFETKEFRLKKRLMRIINHIEIEVVR